MRWGSRSRSGSYTFATGIASVAVVLFYALHKGQDINWDQRNYHLAIPFLLLHGTFWTSVAPAGVQSYLNPLILLPQYFAIRWLPPVAATVAIAAAQVPVFLICAWICRSISGAPDVRAFLGFLLCLMSPIALSEAGTTYVDLVTAVPVVAAFALLLCPGGGRAAAAGFLLGIATGLKLTNGYFAISAAVLCGMAEGGWRRRLTLLAVTAGTAIVGFLLVAGWWHWQLWRRFGNPVFPYFNLLLVPGAGISVGRDARFLPRSAFAVLTYPFYWLLGGSPNPGLLSPAAEVDPRDARYVLILAGTVLALVAAPAGRRRQQANRGDNALIAAWVAGYLAWLFGFGIHRYMVPLEVLAGAVLLCLAKRLPRRHQVWALGAACIVSLIVLHVPSWNRLPWSPRWRTIAAKPIQLDGRPLVFLTSKPTAFLALSLTPPVRLVGFDGELDLSAGSGTVLAAEVGNALRVPGTEAYILTADPLSAEVKQRLGDYGLAPQDGCRAVDLPFLDAALCRLGPIARPP